MDAILEGAVRARATDIHLPGINQVEVDTKAGGTCASGLQAVLRQDADILLVGGFATSKRLHLRGEAAMGERQQGSFEITPRCDGGEAWKIDVL